MNETFYGIEGERIKMSNSNESKELVEIHKTMTNLKRNKDREHQILYILGYLNEMLINPEYPYPDVVSFNIVIHSLGNFGFLGLMYEYFCIMIEYGLRPNVITFTSMLHAYKRHNDVESFYGILDLMQRMGVKHNAHTSHVLSHGLL